jgi:hypothetical protein
MYSKANQKGFADITTQSVPPMNTVDAAAAERSENNILLWKLYLPSTCIDAMIAMGWDRTT